MHAIKRKWKLMSLVLTLIISFGMLIPNQVSAAGKTGTITAYSDFVGMTFDIYHIGDWKQSGGLEYAKPFSNDEKITNIRPQTDEEIKESATNIANVINLDKSQYGFEPTATAQSVQSKGNDQNKAAEVVFKNIAEGAYIIVPRPYKVGTKTYTAVPTFVNIPNWEVINGKKELTWNATAVIKQGKVFGENPVSVPVTISAYKNWDDNKNAKKVRPKSVKLILMSKLTNKKVDTVELNNTNNWSHTWKNLPEDDYAVVEAKKYSQYKNTKIDQSGYVFNVTNKYTGNTGDSATPPTKKGKKSNVAKKLPQTGQLWWPVPFLVCLGLISLIIGLVRKNKNRA